jgi:hypothetical protein
MKPIQGIPQKIPVKMGINFRSGYALMPQHFLHGPEVCTAFHQVCGKRMPECMGRNAFLDVGFQGKILDDVKDHHPG